MTTGFAAGTINGWLDTYDGSYLRLHTGDPGANGTSNGSAEATRKALTFAAASGGFKVANGTMPSWSNWSAGPESISHFSIWSAATAGTFMGSGAFAVSFPVINGNNVALSGLTVSLGPVAA